MSASSRTATARRGPDNGRVRFEFIHPTAKRVCVAGSFNGWNPSATPLAPAGRGRWLRELWLPQDTCEYLFVVDGVWMFDPNATDYMPNIFGGMNAVIEVSCADKCEDRRPTAIRSSLGLSRTKKGKASPSRVACLPDTWRINECAEKVLAGQQIDKDHDNEEGKKMKTTRHSEYPAGDRPLCLSAFAGH